MKKLWKKGFLAYIIVPWNLADIFTLANFMGWIGTYIHAPMSVASNLYGMDWILRYICVSLEVIHTEQACEP